MAQFRSLYLEWCTKLKLFQVNLEIQFMPGKISDNIRSIRELKNYTQQYMALRLGITQAGYSKIENGANAIRLEKLEEIASVFEMSLSDIIDFERNDYWKKPKEEAWQCDVVEKLYKDKIDLLEKLLDKTDKELNKYKDKYGGL